MPGEKPKYVPVESLSEEERTKAESLEEKTDIIYGLRTQLVSFYRNYRHYLPEEKGGKRTHRMHIDEVSDAVQAGKKLEELIPWQRVDAEVEALSKPSQEKEKIKKWRHLQITAAFRRALRVAGELRAHGGAWRGDLSFSLEDKEVSDFYKMRWGEFGKAGRKFDELNGQVKEFEELIDIAHSDLEFSPHPEDINELERQYERAFNEVKELSMQSPEAYLFILGRQLKETKELFDSQGRIVETPYVKAKIARIKGLLDQGRPVFIHGELGTGKTELAKHLARKELSKSHLTRWEAGNPAPAEPEERKKWEERRAEETEAIVISGYRGIEIEQILAARAIERKVPPPPKEQVEEIDNTWQEFSKQLAGKSKEDIKEFTSVRLNL